MAKPNFPRYLYVKEENADGEKFFLADDDVGALADAGEVITIAKYEKMQVQLLDGRAKLLPPGEKVTIS